MNGIRVLPEQQITRVTDECCECRKLAVCCGFLAPSPALPTRLEQWERGQRCALQRSPGALLRATSLGPCKSQHSAADLGHHDAAGLSNASSNSPSRTFEPLMPPICKVDRATISDTRRTTRLHCTRQRRRTRVGPVCTRLRGYQNVANSRAVCTPVVKVAAWKMEDARLIYAGDHKVVNPSRHRTECEVAIGVGQCGQDYPTTLLKSFCSRATTVVPPTMGLLVP
jgi:hypothetical protein